MPVGVKLNMAKCNYTICQALRQTNAPYEKGFRVEGFRPGALKKIGSTGVLYSVHQSKRV